MITGRIHSIETLGTLDGPGIRTIVFLQGCPLRCIYCHNPDTQAFDADTAQTMTPDDILALANRYRPYYGADGGITFSGGEPLAQPDFLEATLSTLKQHSFTTCLDTSVAASPATLRRILPLVDTLLLDIKALTPDAHQAITGTPIDPIDRALETIRTHYHGAIWIRHVMLPGVTDHEAAMDALVDRIMPLSPRITNLQILPFHQLGADKYRQLGRVNPSAHLAPMDKVRAAELETYLREKYQAVKRTSVT